MTCNNLYFLSDRHAHGRRTEDGTQASTGVANSALEALAAIPASIARHAAITATDVTNEQPKNIQERLNGIMRTSDHDNEKQP